MTNPDSYRSIAPYYSLLSRIGTLGAIARLRSKINWDIAQNSSVLAVGVGTGNLLPYLFNQNVNHITALDRSKRMLDLARTNHSAREVSFVLGEFPDVPILSMYDVIVFDFVIDSIDIQEFNRWISYAMNHLKTGGYVVILDFNPFKQDHWYTRLVMRFFRLFTDYKRFNLANWSMELNKSDNLVHINSSSTLFTILLGEVWQKQ